ncbi:Type cbb3 cytochrome oxidase biogenesis protein CcoH [Candidatus Rhodobacter oscarellae]|uniref:Type cbb3 cytochrome oxidase biogenesis protein CcoH n=1 Tax=Candidatus Rhodobacter oscarellae TaxID=1675527 RepID=A0A0J9H323_9RHOB|nr:FixH family protein [Candidatus Rhodobacter lobularis]KMW60073.1 Type cbb3 cytochrome oxidase biogenesis protein CcoH [Candidatus Rhodobacter lobularis]
MRQITGWHVAGIFGLGFGAIIAVNVALAVNAVRTFPGLEVANSYIASQSFDQDRAAQEALAWQVAAVVEGGVLRLSFRKDDRPLAPGIETATFGRATSVAADQTPAFAFNGEDFVAPVQAGPGNWNLRVAVRAADGTRFQQRIIVKVVQ